MSQEIASQILNNLCDVTKSVDGEAQDGSFASWEEYTSMKDLLRFFGQDNPYDAPRDGLSVGTIRIQNRQMSSFCSYNYLGLNGHPDVIEAVIEAAQRYGSSASASRIAGGECLIHRKLERALSDFVGVEDAITTVGGYIANLACINFLVGASDLVIYDEFCHNSIVEGCVHSGAKRLQFRHADYAHLNQLLHSNRKQARRCLVIVESVYSMDGDIADLPRLIDLKTEHNAMLMVDEAHSLGVIGKTGRGICEYSGCSPKDIDILMCTLSKSFASCGGVILGQTALIKMLRYQAPGFHLYSAGLPPTASAAALKALEVMQDEPERLIRLHENSKRFHAACQEEGLDTGTSVGAPIIPIFTHDKGDAQEDMARIMRSFFQKNIHVIGLNYPVVPRNASRLRFFVTSEHRRQDLEQAAQVTAQILTSARG